MLPAFKPPYKWAMDDAGAELLGMAQRFGPYSFVVNTDKISRADRRGSGLEPVERSGQCQASTASSNRTTGTSSTSACIAGFDPFKVHTDEEVAKFTETAKRVFKGAKVVGDIATMNQALISGEIDFHMTGGTYSASPARADGNPNIRGITPKSGPMNGKGGISWIEITSTVNNPRAVAARRRVPRICAGARRWPTPWPSPRAPSIRWRRWAIRSASSLFTKEELDAIQWDSLDEEMSRCVEYDIVPDYDKLLDIMTAAKREASGG